MEEEDNYSEAEVIKSVESDDGYDNGSSDTDDRENKHTFFLSTNPKLFNCSICDENFFGPVFQCELEELHIACSLSATFHLHMTVPSVLSLPDIGFAGSWRSLSNRLKNHAKIGNTDAKKRVEYRTNHYHKEHCKLVPCSCPIDGCNFLSSSIKLSQHLSRKPPNSVTCFHYNRFCNISLGTSETFCVLQETYDGDLSPLKKNNVKSSDTKIENFVSISRIGACSVTSRLTVDLEVNDGERRSLKFTYEIESNSVSYVDKRWNFVLVPSGFFALRKLEVTSPNFPAVPAPNLRISILLCCFSNWFSSLYNCERNRSLV